MANKAYDPNADERRTPKADNSIGNNQTSAGNVSYGRGNPDRGSLRNAEENGFYNPGGDSSPGNSQSSPGRTSYGNDGSPSPGRSSKPVSPTNLKGAEESGLG